MIFDDSTGEKEPTLVISRRTKFLHRRWCCHRQVAVHMAEYIFIHEENNKPTLSLLDPGNTH
jgi:hypothetical protein